jgi:hypothetical protein
MPARRQHPFELTPAVEQSALVFHHRYLSVKNQQPGDYHNHKKEENPVHQHKSFLSALPSIPLKLKGVWLFIEAILLQETEGGQRRS